MDKKFAKTIVPPYSIFAEIYDSTMQGVAYKRWASFTHEIIKEFYPTSRMQTNFFKASFTKPKDQKNILEIACGSGTFLRYFNNFYDGVIGIDISLSMLQKAKNKLNKPSAKKRTPLLQADMCNMPFADNSFDVLINLHDSLNYLQTKKKLQKHFLEASRILQKDGIYIFDLSSEYNVIHYYNGKTFDEKHNGMRMVWTNDYNFITHVLTSIIEVSDQHATFKEIHKQKIFQEKEVMRIAVSAGFELLASYGDYKRNNQKKDAQLLVYVFKKYTDVI